MNIYDLLILGGGLVGLHIAEGLHELGYKVLIIERDYDVGGALRFPLRERGIIKGKNYGFEIIREATVIDILDKKRVCVVSSYGLQTLTGKAVLIATGSRDIVPAELFIGGFRPKGVYTLTMAWRLLEIGVDLGNHIAILGHGEFARLLVEYLKKKGYDVYLITPFEKPNWASDINVFQGYTVSEVLGKREIKGVKIVKSTGGYEPIGSGREIIKCNALIIAAGFRPYLPFREFKLTLDPNTNGPKVDLNMTSKEGLFIAGGALAPFEKLESVMKTASMALNGIKRLLEGEYTKGDSITVRCGRNMRFVLPQIIYQGKDVPLIYSAKHGSKKIHIKELNVDIEIEDYEGIININVNGVKSLTLHAF